jgi:hypothetical protein
MSASEYKKHQEGGATVFHVTPAPHRKFWFAIIGGGLMLLFGLTTFGSEHLLGLIMLGGGGAALWWGWTHDLRPASHRTPSTFRVTPDSIESGGQTFKKSEIHRLIVKNGITHNVVGIPGVLVPVSTPTAIGAAHRMEVSLTSNGLEVESGGRGHVLAGGMDETTAFGLLTDVSRVLGLNVSSG